MHVVGRAAVRQIQVVGLRRVFGRQRVNLFHHRHHSEALAETAHSEDAVFHVALEAHGARHLEVGESLPLGLGKQLLRQLGELYVVVPPLVQLLRCLHDIL